MASGVLQLRAQRHHQPSGTWGEGLEPCISNQLKTLELREVKNLPKGPQLVSIIARSFTQGDLSSKG